MPYSEESKRNLDDAAGDDYHLLATDKTETNTNYLRPFTLSNTQERGNQIKQSKLCWTLEQYQAAIYRLHLRNDLTN